MVFLAERDVIAPHEPVLEAPVANLDALQPFRVGDAVPARRDQPEREAVVGRQGSAVHLVAKDVLCIHGVGERHAAREILRELDLIGARDLSLVGAPENDLNAAVEDAGLLQDRGESRAGPEGVANAAVEERQAGVARAFDCEGDLLARPLLMSSSVRVVGFLTRPSISSFQVAASMVGRLKCAIEKNLSFGVIQESKSSQTS